MALSLMPSEIARLVYGYFLEMGCENSAKTFLKESSHLKEFADGIQNGQRYSTTINQQSLLQMLNADVDFVKSGSLRNDNNQSVSHMGEDIKVTMLNHINRLQSYLSELSSIVNEDGNTNLSVDVTPRNNKLPQRSFSENISPRRKCTTPKRITKQNDSPVSQTSNVSDHNGAANSSNTTNNTSTSSLASTTTGQSQEVIEYVVNRKLMYEELLNCKPLQEKLAIKINNKIASDFKKSSSGNLQPGNLVSSCAKKDSNEFVIGNIEKDLLPPEILDEIINSILEEPECSELIAMVIEKDPEFQPVNLFSKLLSTAAEGTETGKDSVSSALKKSSDEKTSCSVPNKPIAAKANLFGETTTNGQSRVGQELTANKANEQQAKTNILHQHPQLNKGTYGFRGLRNKQREVQQARNSTSPTDANLTTLIEKLQPTSTAGPPHSQPSQLSSVATPSAIPNVVSVSNWPSNFCNPYFIPSQNKTATAAKDGIILSTIPNPNQPIIYLSNQSFITSVQSNASLPTALIPNQILSIRPPINSLPNGSPVGSNTNQATERSRSVINREESSLRMETIVSSSEQLNSNSSIKLSRALPTILGKPKVKIILPATSNSSSMVSLAEVLKATTTAKNDVIDRRNVPQTSGHKESQDNTAHLKPITSDANRTRNGKRKSDESAIKASANKAKKGAAMIDTDDPKIKTLLNTNFDKFLGNIHKNSPNQQPKKGEANKKAHCK